MMLGGIPAPHRAILLNTKEQIADPQEPLRLMVISSKHPQPDDVELPYKKHANAHPTTKLTVKCHAVAEWILLVTDRSRLGTYTGGYLSGKALQKVLSAYYYAEQDGVRAFLYPSDPRNVSRMPISTQPMSLDAIASLLRRNAPPAS